MAPIPSSPASDVQGGTRFDDTSPLADTEILPNERQEDATALGGKPPITNLKNALEFGI